MTANQVSSGPSEPQVTRETERHPWYPCRALSSRPPMGTSARGDPPLPRAMRATGRSNHRQRAHAFCSSPFLVSFSEWKNIGPPLKDLLMFVYNACIILSTEGRVFLSLLSSRLKWQRPTGKATQTQARGLSGHCSFQGVLGAESVRTAASAVPQLQSPRDQEQAGPQDLAVYPGQSEPLLGPPTSSAGRAWRRLRSENVFLTMLKNVSRGHVNPCPQPDHWDGTPSSEGSSGRGPGA